jgi:ornithine decarboxylase
VRLLTFDNTDELWKIRKLYPQAKLLLQIQVNDIKQNAARVSKFGAAPDAVPNLLVLARHLGLNVVGIR